MTCRTPDTPEMLLAEGRVQVLRADMRGGAVEFECPTRAHVFAARWRDFGEPTCTCPATAQPCAHLVALGWLTTSARPHIIDTRRTP